MQFVPRIKPIRQTNREKYAVPPKCTEIVEKLKLEKRREILLLQHIDPSKILHLLLSFDHRTAGGMEKQLNKYFMRELSATWSFIGTFINEEVQIRAVGPRKLKYLHKVFLGKGVVDSLYQRCISGQKQPLGQLHPMVRQCFEDVLEGNEGDLVSIPVLTPEESPVKLLLVSLVDAQEDLMFITQFVYETFRYCLPTLLNTIVHDLVKMERENLESLSNMLNRLYYSFHDIREVAKILLENAVAITQSTLGFLYLVDSGYNDMKCRVFNTLNDKVKWLDLLNSQRIAGRTARLGKYIMIKRNQTDLLEKLPNSLNVKVKCIFSFPIFYNGKLIGVVQLYNKRGGDYTLQDSEIGLMFNDFCGEILAKCIEYYRLLTMDTQLQSSYAMLTNHIKFDEASVQYLLDCPHEYPNFSTFEFDTRSMPFADTTIWTLKIFDSLKLLQRFKIDRSKFAKFILHIKFGYNDVPYHNWFLAFRSLHYAYTVIISMQLMEKKIICELDVFVVLVTCMVHELGFRGHTGAFKLQLGAPLENMYASAGQVVEIHHFEQLVQILHLNECNILEGLDNVTFSNFLEMMSKNLLLKDITKSQYLRRDHVVHYNSLFSMRSIPPRLKYLFMVILIQAATLSDFTKDFQTSLYAFKLIHKEIFESSHFELLPYNNLPENVQFYTLPQQHRLFYKNLVRPVFEILTDFLPDFSYLLDSIDIVDMCWKYSQQVIRPKLDQRQDAIEIMDRDSFAEMVLDAVATGDEQFEHEEVIPVISSEAEAVDEDEAESEEEDDDHSDEDEDRQLLAALEESQQSLFRVGLGFDVI